MERSLDPCGEIYGEFTVDVMEFVFILAISLLELFRIHLLRLWR